MVAQASLPAESPGPYPDPVKCLRDPRSDLFSASAGINLEALLTSRPEAQGGKEPEHPASGRRQTLALLPLPFPKLGYDRSFSSSWLFPERL